MVAKQVDSNLVTEVRAIILESKTVTDIDDSYMDRYHYAILNNQVNVLTLLPNKVIRTDRKLYKPSIKSLSSYMPLYNDGSGKSINDIAVWVFLNKNHDGNVDAVTFDYVAKLCAHLMKVHHLKNSDIYECFDIFQDCKDRVFKLGEISKLKILSQRYYDNYNPMWFE